ncbi:MAG: hypothetical protein E6Q98_15880 [Rhodospirillaceae bacterium]|nr:MAG: hypothetical protein E6Q98_15880 [Rhodospirillaceae bacterium]
MRSAATALRNLSVDRPALPRQTVHNSLHNRSNRFQHPSALAAAPRLSLQSKSATEVRVKYRANSPKSLGKTISDALWRRVNCRALTREQLREGLNCSASTIDNLMSGNHDPSGPILMALLAFADDALANEILEPTGCTVAKLCDRRAAALKKVAEGMAELRAAEG